MGTNLSRLAGAALFAALLVSGPRAAAQSPTAPAAPAAPAAAAAPAPAAPAAPAAMTAPQPTVPEIFTLEGEFVRVAYNNEGFVSVGYRLANDSVGQDWMYLVAGFTVVRPTKDYRLVREAISLRTPDGKTVALATQKEYGEALYLGALNDRAKVIRDPMNYFPVDAARPCPLQFFADLGSPGQGVSWDWVELGWQRACTGRLFFKVPGKIQPGQYWLDVKFAASTVQVPFRIFTKDEEKVFRKKWEDFKKAHDATYK